MTATTVPPSTATTEEATKRFRMAEFIQRNGNRVQKRAVAAGRASKNVATNMGKGLAHQITEPYTATKQILGAVGLIALGVGMWYYTFVVALAIVAGTGSWLLAVGGAVAFYMIVARFIYLPITLAMAGYYSNAQTHKATAINRTMSVRKAPAHAM